MRLFLQFLLSFFLLTQICFAQWFWQNPLPQGNILRSVKFISSSVGWAVGQAGTIINTTNGGTTWTLQTSGTTNNLGGVSFTDASDGWAVGTGGIILKTTNGGTTWVSQVSGTSAELTDVCFTDVYNGWAVGWGTVLKTTNGGITWSQLSGIPYSLLSVSFTDANNGTAVGPSGKILRTTDGGSTWVSQWSNNDYFTAVSFTDAENGTTVGEDGTILRTTSGGENWLYQTSGTTNWLFGVSFTDANNGVAVGSEGIILKTTDGGTTWISQISGTTEELTDVSFTDASNGTAVGGATILRTTNGGLSWIPQSSGNTGNLMSVSFTDINNGTAVGAGVPYGAYSPILRTTDSGITWVLQSSETVKALIGVYFTDTNNGITVGREGTILRTTDGGTNWIPQISGTLQWLFDVYFTDVDNGWSVGWQGTILKTTNGGSTWSAQSSGTTNDLEGVYFIDSNNGTAVGSNGTILRTTNGGTTWNPQTSGITTSLNDVSFSDANTGTVVGYEGTILRTTDSGTSWIPQISGTTDLLYDVSFTNASNGTAVGNYGIILRTTDGGTSWIQQLSGTSSPLLGVRFTDSNNGTAVGSNGTILRTTNGGGIFVSTTITSNATAGSQILEVASNEGFSIGDYIIVNPNGLNEELNRITDFGSFILEVPLTYEHFVGEAVIETIEPTTFQLAISVTNGWNMVSAPGTNPAGMLVGDWWPNQDPAFSVFLYNGIQYLPATTAVPGDGYWMNNSLTETYSYPAIGIVAHAPIPVTIGWNMIGGYETSPTITALKAANPQITGSVFEYNGIQYFPATNLVPGYGYWVEVTTTDPITIPSALSKGSGEVAELFKEDWGRITLTDAEGKSYTLYAVKGEVDLNQYNMPPLPPAGSFDIRFSSGRIAEDINGSMQSIDLTGVTYPLTVRVDGMDIRLQDVTGNAVNVNLKSGEDVVIGDATVQKLMVTGEVIPAVYALEQNYPNPFNPSTVIEFSLPEDVSNVKLSIYNALGEKVAEIVNTSLAAGRYQYQWNAKNVATGMYIYELRTDKFVSVKKMVLLR